MRLSRLIALLGLQWTLPVWAQLDFPDSDFEAAFDSFRDSQQAEYTRFTDQADQEFSAWLEQAWESYRRFAPRERDSRPKPPVAPVAPDSRPPETVDKSAIRPAPAPLSSASVSFDFYGYGVSAPPWPAHLPPLKSVKEADVAEGWRALSTLRYAPVIDFLQEQCKSLSCGDWAQIMFAREYSRWVASSQGADDSRRALLQWFLLDKLGFKVRGGRVQNGGSDTAQLVVLYQPLQTVFGVPYFSVGGDELYPLEPLPAGKFFSYKPGYEPEQAFTRRAVELDFARTLSVPGKLAKRRLSWPRVEGQSLDLQYDDSRRRYLDQHPQVDLKWYFRAPLDPVLRASIDETLTRRLEGMSPERQVEALLHFVQFSIAYATDKEQFGRENYLLSEQLLHYPAADCEDRSIFFAALVRTLTGLPVVGLLYPGHVATAVALPELDSASDFELQGLGYRFADPTYIGAGLGEAMPQFRDVAGTIIDSAVAANSRVRE